MYIEKDYDFDYYIKLSILTEGFAGIFNKSLPEKRRFLRDFGIEKILIGNRKVHFSNCGTYSVDEVIEIAETESGEYLEKYREKFETDVRNGKHSCFGRQGKLNLMTGIFLGLNKFSN